MVGSAANHVALAKRRTYNGRFSAVPPTFLVFAAEPHGALGSEAYRILMDHLRPLIHERNGQNRVQAGLDLLRVRRLLSLGIAVGYAEGFQLLRDGPVPHAVAV